MSSDEGLEVDRPLRQKNKSFTKTEIQPVLQKNLLPQYASCTDLDMTEDEADGPISELALKGKKILLCIPQIGIVRNMSN